MARDGGRYRSAGRYITKATENRIHGRLCKRHQARVGLLVGATGASVVGDSEIRDGKQNHFAERSGQLSGRQLYETCDPDRVGHAKQQVPI